MFTSYARPRGIAKGTQRRLRIVITSTLALFCSLLMCTSSSAHSLRPPTQPLAEHHRAAEGCPTDSPP